MTTMTTMMITTFMMTTTAIDKKGFMQMKKLKCVLLSVCLLGTMFSFTSCGNSSETSENSSEISEVVTEEVTTEEITTEPIISEEEAFEKARDKIDKKLRKVPEYEVPLAEGYPYVVFNEYGGLVFQEKNISYDESENVYIVEAAGTLGVCYSAPNGVGLFPTDVKMTFEAELEVNAVTGFAKFTTPIEYEFEGEGKGGLAAFD